MKTNWISRTRTPFFLILIFFLPVTGSCQDLPSGSGSKISIGPLFSPDFSYRHLSGDAQYQYQIANSNNYDIAKISYSGGFSLMYKLINRIDIVTGLLYSDKGEKTKELPVSYLSVSPSGRAVSSFVNYHMEYMDIPIRVNYYLRNKRLKIFASLGVVADVLLTERIAETLQYTDGHTTTSSTKNRNGFHPVDLSLAAGMGFKYEVTEHMSLLLAPLYTRFITPLDNGPIKSYLYTVGLNIGVYFRL